MDSSRVYVSEAFAEGSDAKDKLRKVVGFCRAVRRMGPVKTT